MKLLGVLLGAAVAVSAHAQQEIRIGVIYPLTGSAASVGGELRNALELAAEIINNGAPGMPDLPFSQGKGLPNLKGAKPGNMVTLNENGLWGTETGKLQARLAPDYKYNLVKQVPYAAKTTQLTSEVQALKAANPNLVLQSSYTADAILSMKTYKELGFSPDMILANNAGFTDTEFIKTLGKDAEYIITREVWALDLAKTKPIIRQVNDLFQARYKINFTGNSSRTFTGLMVLADAINRAGSTDPEAIRKALAATDLSGKGLIMPWKGVKFDATGQNTLGQGILVQIMDGKYNTVWPFDLASREVTWPMPKWDQRK